MEIHYTDSIFAVQSDGNALLMLTIPKNQKRLYDDIKAFENDILKVMTIEYFKEKRSKDANSGFWLMCDRIAKKVGNTKDNIYVEMVKKYGVFDDLIMAAEVFPIYEKRHNESSSVKFTKEYSLCDIAERYRKGEQEWVKVRSYPGTSVYSKDDFKPLLDGVIDEAKELGIPFFSRDELDQMLMVWDKRKKEVE